jgi:hypothetical protein
MNLPLVFLTFFLVLLVIGTILIVLINKYHHKEPDLDVKDIKYVSESIKINDQKHSSDIGVEQLTDGSNLVHYTIDHTAAIGLAKDLVSENYNIRHYVDVISEHIMVSKRRQQILCFEIGYSYITLHTHFQDNIFKRPFKDSAELLQIIEAFEQDFEFVGVL